MLTNLPFFAHLIASIVAPEEFRCDRLVLARGLKLEKLTFDRSGVAEEKDFRGCLTAYLKDNKHRCCWINSKGSNLAAPSCIDILVATLVETLERLHVCYRIPAENTVPMQRFCKYTAPHFTHLVPCRWSCRAGLRCRRSRMPRCLFICH